MDPTTITSIPELHDHLTRYQRDTRWKFRGHADARWSLVPKAGRAGYSHYNDEKAFKQWERGAFPHLDLTKLNALERLAVAQHYGMATRLLDWSHSPLIALFFAVVDMVDVDGCIYAMRVREMLDENANPFSGKDSVRYYQPKISSDRIASQLGHFTLHCPPTVDMADEWRSDDLERFIIPSELKADVVMQLHFYGINYKSIFPDMYGLSRHLLWWLENSSYWSGKPSA